MDERKKLHKEVSELTDAELVKWVSLFAHKNDLNAEVANINAEFAELAAQLRVPSSADIEAEIKAELQKRTRAKS